MGVFKITQPGDIQLDGANGNLDCKLTWNSGFSAKMEGKLEAAQKIVDSECLRYMNPLTPMRTGAMIRSATIGTVIGTGEIKYASPYARRQYYSNKGGSPAHPQARGLWFETMKAAHLEDIRRAAGKALSDD